MIAPTFEVAHGKSSPVATVKSHSESKQFFWTPPSPQGGHCVMQLKWNKRLDRFDIRRDLCFLMSQGTAKSTLPPTRLRYLLNPLHSQPWNAFQSNPARPPKHRRQTKNTQTGKTDACPNWQGKILAGQSLATARPATHWLAIYNKPEGYNGSQSIESVVLVRVSHAHDNKKPPAPLFSKLGNGQINIMSGTTMFCWLRESQFVSATHAI